VLIFTVVKKSPLFGGAISVEDHISGTLEEVETTVDNVSDANDQESMSLTVLVDPREEAVWRCH